MNFIDAYYQTKHTHTNDLPDWNCFESEKRKKEKSEFFGRQVIHCLAGVYAYANANAHVSDMISKSSCYFIHIKCLCECVLGITLEHFYGWCLKKKTTKKQNELLGVKK